MQTWPSGKLPFECQKIGQKLYFFYYSILEKKEKFWQLKKKSLVCIKFLTMKCQFSGGWDRELTFDILLYVLSPALQAVLQHSQLLVRHRLGQRRQRGELSRSHHTTLSLWGAAGASGQRHGHVTTGGKAGLHRRVLGEGGGITLVSLFGHGKAASTGEDKSDPGMSGLSKCTETDRIKSHICPRLIICDKGSRIKDYMKSVTEPPTFSI